MQVLYRSLRFELFGRIVHSGGCREAGNSIYLHTFAVRRSNAGLGIGALVIEQVVSMGRDHGRTNVRLDCFLSNAGLIAFYERYGFASVGFTSMKGKKYEYNGANNLNYRSGLSEIMPLR